MYDTVVVATDGSESVERAVTVATDFAGRFEADCHALYVVDTRVFADAPRDLRPDLRAAVEDRGRAALADVEDRADGVTTEIREGRPAEEIVDYAREVDADVVATGTRGRHGEGRIVLGSVAEEVVRTAPMPVLTVRKLAEEE
ncbi:universal stress protein [Halobacteriales archaeon QS_8_69_26]|nr:MAG: universal stress protein [Halobacteriales archaeon QS_8_69_26]